MERTQPKRKFHDAWAFALYLITTIITYGLAFTSKEKVIRESTISLFNQNLLKGLMVNSIAVLSTFIFFTTVPAFFIHLSFFFCIAANLFFAIYFKSTIAIVFAVIGGIFTLIMYYLCFNYIKFTGKLLKETTFIIFKYIFGFIGLFLVTICIFAAQIYVTFPLMIKAENNQSVLYILFVFYWFWTVFNGFYFFMVFAASVISFHLFSKGTKQDTFVPALKNSIFCFGSICLGALLLAIVSTLRYLVDKDESDRRRRGESTDLLRTILRLILQIFLALLEQIIAFVNEWTFVYMAIYGKNYVNSVRESFSKITRPENMLLVSNLIVDKVIFMFLLSFSLGYLWITDLFTILQSQTDMDVILSFVFPFLFCVYFLDWFYSLFSSGAKTILFVNDEDRKCIKETLPELASEFESLQSK